MTYPNDSNQRPTPPMRASRTNSSAMPWVIGAIAIMAVLGFLFWGSGMNTASNTTLPTTSQTTGSAAPSSGSSSGMTTTPNAPAPAK